MVATAVALSCFPLVPALGGAAFPHVCKCCVPSRDRARCRQWPRAAGLLSPGGARSRSHAPGQATGASARPVLLILLSYARLDAERKAVILFVMLSFVVFFFFLNTYFRQTNKLITPTSCRDASNHIRGSVLPSRCCQDSLSRQQH